MTIDPDPNRSGYARVLAETLPYLQAVQRQTVVIACCGDPLTDPALRAGLVSDIALLSLIGCRPVLVHGQSPDAVPDVSYLAGINRLLVRELLDCGIDTVGMSGDSLRCRLNDGRLVAPECQSVSGWLEQHVVPVIMASSLDQGGVEHALPVDTLGGLLAWQLQGRLVLMTDALTLAAMREAARLTPAVLEAQLDALPEDARACSRSALEALAHGVKMVYVLDIGVPGSLLGELLCEEGEGLLLCRHHRAHVLSDSNRYFAAGESVLHDDWRVRQKYVARF